MSTEEAMVKYVDELRKVRTSCMQCNLSIKDTRKKGHLSNEDTACCPTHIELCTDLPLN